MLIIPLKIILTGLVFYGFYQFVLAKQKMLVFNRFYLLGSLLLSGIIPFVNIKIPASIQTSNLIVGEPELPVSAVSARSETVSAADIFMYFYLLVSFAVLIIFIVKIFKINTLKGLVVRFHNQKIKILAGQHLAFSFWNTMFLSRDFFLNNCPDEKIFLHERAHILQKHSADILITELLKIVFWWNPMLYVFKQRIVENHEFLADDFVLKHGISLKEYQVSLLSVIAGRQKISFVHSFNFNQTKKRFIMMKNLPKSYTTIRIAMASFTAFAVFLSFAPKKYEAEQSQENSTENSSKLTVPSTSFQNKTLRKAGFQKEEQGNYDLTANSAIERDTVKKATEEVAANAVSSASTAAVSEDNTDFVQAQFPGGMTVFRNRIAQNFDTSVFTGKEGTVKTEIFISIDDEGNVDHVKAEGDNEIFNKESMRTVEKVAKSQTWIPATKDGIAVKTVFKTPLTMKFEF